MHHPMKQNRQAIASKSNKTPKLNKPILNNKHITKIMNKSKENFFNFISLKYTPVAKNAKNSAKSKSENTLSNEKYNKRI